MGGGQALAWPPDANRSLRSVPTTGPDTHCATDNRHATGVSVADRVPSCKNGLEFAGRGAKPPAKQPNRGLQDVSEAEPAGVWVWFQDVGLV